MKGVDNLELEILQAKADGLLYPSCSKPDVIMAHASLKSRGLLVYSYKTRCICGCNSEVPVNVITKMGRIVLAVSMGAL